MDEDTPIRQQVSDYRDDYVNDEPRFLTHAKSINNATDDQLREMPRRNLKYGAYDVESDSHPNCFFTTQLVSVEESENRAEEGTELEGRR